MIRLKRKVKKPAWLVTHLVSMTGLQAKKGKRLLVKSGDEIIVTVKPSK